MKANSSTVRQRKERPIINNRDTMVATSQLADLNNKMIAERNKALNQTNKKAYDSDEDMDAESDWSEYSD